MNKYERYNRTSFFFLSLDISRKLSLIKYCHFIRKRSSSKHESQKFKVDELRPGKFASKNAEEIEKGCRIRDKRSYLGSRTMNYLFYCLTISCVYRAGLEMGRAEPLARKGQCVFHLNRAI